MLRDHVAGFKKLLKPELHDRVGVVCYQRIADILDDHGEADPTPCVYGCDAGRSSSCLLGCNALRRSSLRRP